MKFPESQSEEQTVTFTTKKGDANMSPSQIADNFFQNLRLGNYEGKQKDTWKTK
jgi:hypothetical protein